MSEFGSLPKMVLEIAVLAALIYVALRFLRETRGSNVVRGLGLLLFGGVTAFVLLIYGLKLEHLGHLSNILTQSVILALVVVFHPEIRSAIVHLGDSPIFGRFFPQESKIVQRVLRAIARMSKERIGALIAIERDASLQTLADSGINIDAELNSFLIESIFFPKSALHDGAIVVRDDRIVAASCLLPLSQNPEVDKRLGTRHRAALGLSEETDALAIVVSEETGKISTAIGGKLQFDLSLDQLERQMEEALGNRQSSSQTDKRRRSFWSVVIHDPVRKLAALVLGIGVYYLLDNQIATEWPVTLALRATAPGESAKANFAHGNQLLVDLPLDRVELKGFVDIGTGNRQDTVSLSIRAPRYVIDNLQRDQTIELPIKLPPVDWEKLATVEFTVDDIQRTLQLSQPNVTLKMDPPRIRIDASPISRQDLQLNLDMIDLQLGGDERLRSRLRTEKPEFSRPTARIVGAAAAMQAFANRTDRPFRAELRAAGDADRTVSAVITLHPRYAEQGLRLAEQISLTLQLTPVMQEFTVELPLRIDDLSMPLELRGRYQPDFTAKQVKIKAGGALLSKLIGEGDRVAAWARTNLRLSVWIQPRDDSSTYPPEFTTQANLEVLGTLRDLVTAQDCGLVETVSVTLRRPGP